MKRREWRKLNWKYYKYPWRALLAPPEELWYQDWWLYREEEDDHCWRYPGGVLDGTLQRCIEWQELHEL